MHDIVVSKSNKLPPIHAATYETHPRANSRSFVFYDESIDFDPFQWHYHPELELVYWNSASGVRMIGDSIENFHGGDLCFIGSNTPHTWSIDINKGKLEDNIQVQFMPDFLGEDFLNLPEMNLLKQFFQQAKYGLKIFGPTRRSISARLLNITQSRPNPSERFCELLSLFVELAQSKYLKPLSTAVYSLPTIDSEAGKAISSILEFVKLHLDDDASQSKAAKLVLMPPASFSRFFKRHFGKTYTSFVNEMRVGKACSLLSETDISISDVAYRSGFQNLSHFNEQFRIYKRINPSAYRLWVRHEFSKSNQNSRSRR
jgi:AraC-like DNA-binding protein